MAGLEFVRLMYSQKTYMDFYHIFGIHVSKDELELIRLLAVCWQTFCHFYPTAFYNRHYDSRSVEWVGGQQEKCVQAGSGKA